jgi:TetR/AcrR family transcriptional regulator
VDRWLSSVPPELEGPDPESPRGRILAAARWSFAENGFDSTTTRSIAERAGVNLAMLHYYFDSKEALYRRVLAGEMIQVFGAMAGALAQTDNTPVERLLDLVGRTNRAFRNDPVRLSLIRHELGDGAPHAVTVVQELGATGPKGFRDVLAAAISMAQSEGRMVSAEPRSIVGFLLMHAYGPVILEPILRVLFDAPHLDDERWEQILGGQRELLRRALVPRDAEEAGS